MPFSLATLLGVTAPEELGRFHAWLARMAQRPSVQADAQLMRDDAARIAALAR